MKEPVRWKDDPNAPVGARDLLVHGEPTSAMPPQARALIAAELGAGVGVGATATTAGSTFIVVAKVAAGVAALGVAGGTAMWALSDRTPPPPVTHQAPQPEVVDAPPAVVDAPPAVVVAPPLTAPAVKAKSVRLEAKTRPTAKPRRSVNRKRPSTVPAAPDRAGPAQDLVKEAALLEKARRAAVEAPSRALAIVERHATQYPDGALAAEREVLAIEVLGRLGRHDASRVRATRFLQRHQNSPYAELVRRTLRQ